MTNKKKLKRKNRRLKKEAQQAYDDYKSLGSDTIDLTLLYHDIIALFVGMDKGFFLRSVRAADLESIEKLQSELKRLHEENREQQNELERCYDKSIKWGQVARKLRAENEQLKKSKVKMWLNGERIEVAGGYD